MYQTFHPTRHFLHIKVSQNYNHLFYKTEVPGRAAWQHAETVCLMHVTFYTAVTELTLLFPCKVAQRLGLVLETRPFESRPVHRLSWGFPGSPQSLRDNTLNQIKPFPSHTHWISSKTSTPQTELLIVSLYKIQIIISLLKCRLNFSEVNYRTRRKT
jgi:hypothetical protein